MSAASLSAPPLAFEHLEHCDVLGVERIALDRLQVHRLKPKLAQLGDFGLGEFLFRKVAHAQIIASASEKVAQSKDEA